MRSIRLSLALVMLSPWPSFAIDPVQMMGNIKGVDLPTQMLPVPKVDGGSMDDNTTLHCYVFPQFAAIEMSSGQIGADSIALRQRAEGQSDTDLCKLSKQPGDRFVDSPEGYVLGARGPFLFVTAADSSGSQNGLAVYQSANGKKLFDVERNLAKPMVARYEGGVLSLHYFVALAMDCNPAEDTCWADTLQKNHIPQEAVVVRPDCGDRAANPKAVQISASVIVADVAHPKIAYENGQPTCDPAP